MNVEAMLRKATEMKRKNEDYISNAFLNTAQWKELDDKGLLEICEYDSSIWVAIKDKDIYRLIFFAKSPQSVLEVDFDKYKLFDKPVVLELLDKKNFAQRMDAILKEVGFSMIKGLYRMFCSDIHIEEQYLADGYCVQNATYDDCDEVYNILYEIFDICISRLPSKEQIIKDIEEEQIFVVRDLQKVVGIAYFQKQGAKSQYLYQLALKQEAQGQKLTYPLLEYAVKCLGSDKQYSVWVESDNSKAIHVYEKLGFQCDGLNEYIYQYK